MKTLVKASLTASARIWAGRAARGVEGRHQRTHAGAGDAVDRDVVLLKPLQDADVRQAQRAAALQSNADSRATWRLNGGQSRLNRGRRIQCRRRILGLLRRGGCRQKGGKQNCYGLTTHGHTLTPPPALSRERLSATLRRRAV